MNIQSVSETDSEALKKLARISIYESVDVEDDLKPEIVSDTYSHIDTNIQKENSVFLKYSIPDITGFILIQDYWNLSDLFVHPDAQSQGIGKLLFTAAKEACYSNQNKGYIRVNSSRNAESFYRKLGFVSFSPEKKIPEYVVPLIYNF